MAIDEAEKHDTTVESADPRFNAAFPTLTEAQIKALEPFGTLIKRAKGEHVWEAGTPNMCMFVVVEGTMHVLDGRTGAFIADHTKGGFSGDIDVLSGRPTVVSAVAATDMEILEVPAECTKSIVAERPELGQIILKAFMTRRALLQEKSGIGALVVGSRFSPDTLRIREFLSRNRYPFTWEDLEENPMTTKMLKEFHITEDETPVVVSPTGDVLRVPTNAELAGCLGMARPIESKIYDLVVIGAGPAGLAAGVYGASEGLSTLVIDSTGPGGQAGTSSRIENYMGFPNGLSGQDLADRAVAQAEKFGAQMIVPAVVENVTCNDSGGHEIMIEGREPISTKCVILATGASYRKLDVDNNADYEGRGIYYSATNVERILCNGSSVAVVGAGNSAGQAAVFLAEKCKHVCLVVRGDDMRKTMSSYLARRIEKSENITVHLNCEVCGLHGDGHLDSASILDRISKGKVTEPVDGVFVMIGAVPHTDWLPAAVVRDSKGFILTGQQLIDEGKWKLDRQPFYLETSCPGVFAVGDARAGSVKRVASAVGEGSMAVAFVHQFLAM